MSDFRALASQPGTAVPQIPFQSVRVGDCSDALPPRAKDTYLALMERADELHAPIGKMLDEREELRQEIGRHKTQISRIAHTAKIVGSEGSIEAEERKVAGLQDRLDRISSRIERAQMAWQPARAIVHNVEAYMGRLGGLDLADADVPEVPLRKGESIQTAVENRRRRVRELAADVRKIAAAPIPSKIVKERARAEIEALAERGRPDLLGAVEYGERTKWPKAKINFAFDPKIGPIFAEAVDPLGLLAYVFKDQLVAKVESEIDLMANDDVALDPAKRPELVATAKRDALATEFEIEALIRQAAEQGVDIPRDITADPRALLMLGGDLPEPRED